MGTKSTSTMLSAIIVLFAYLSILNVSASKHLTKETSASDVNNHFDTLPNDSLFISPHVLAMSSENLGSLLSSTAKFLNNDTGEVKGDTFFDTYYRFMLPFKEANKIESGKFLEDTLTLVAQRNLQHVKNISLTPLQIWISVKPKGDITRTLETILNLTKHVNTLYNGTVSSIVVDYEFLKLNSESLNVIQQDVQLCNSKFRHSLSCGFIFLLANCNTSYMGQLRFEPQNFVILSTDRRSDRSFFTASLTQASTCPRKDVTLMVHNGITVDFGTATYSQEWVFFRRAKGEAVTPTVVVVDFLNDVREMDAGEVLSTNEEWLRLPSIYETDLAWVSLSIEDPIDDTLIAPVKEKFRTFMIEVGGNDISPKLENYFQALASHSQKGGDLSLNIGGHSKVIFKVKLQVVIGRSSYEANQALLNQVFEAVKLSDVKYSGIVDTLILDRDRCLDKNYFPFLLALKDAMFTVENKTWEYIMLKVDQLKLKLPLKLGTTFDKRETLFSKIPEVFHQPETHFKPVENSTSQEQTQIVNKMRSLLASLISYPSMVTLWKLNSLHVELHYFVYKLYVCWDDLKSRGAQATFQNLRVDIDAGNLLFFTGRHKAELRDFTPPQAVYHIVVVGCSGHDSDEKELTEFVYFYDIVNKWAASENKTVILGKALEISTSGQDMSTYQCSSNSSSCINKRHRCGLWNVQSNNSTTVIDNKKSTLLKLYNRRTQVKIEDAQHIKKELSRWALLSILIPILLVAIIASAVTPYLVHKYRSKHCVNSRHLQKFFKGSKIITRSSDAATKGSAFANSQPYDKESFEINRSSIKFDEKHSLGSGEFGNVFLGSLVRRDRTEVPVAIKTVRRKNHGDQYGHEMAFVGLLSEIKILCYIGDHKNIVRLVGAITGNAKRGEVYLLLELCSNGSLLKHLRTYAHNIPLGKDHVKSGKMTNLDAALENNLLKELTCDLFRWSVEIASGMEYLAEKELVHLDVAARNILLDTNKCAKICDFGLSRRLYGYSCYIKNGTEPLPWRWMSPESLQRSVFTEKTDVWAYGVTLWEIYTLGDVPYPEMEWDVNFPVLLNGGYRLRQPSYCTQEMYELMTRCWDGSEYNRPTFSEIVLNLRENINLDHLAYR